jgi:hypothetical protein
MPERLLAVLLIALTAGSASARPLERLPHRTVRELAIRADTVVLAEATDGQPSRFRVLDRFLGEQVKVGENVDVPELARYWADFQGQQIVPEKPRIHQALLFLAPRQGAGALGLISAGVRILTPERGVLWPRQLENPGPYRLVACDDTEWGPLVRKVRDDCAAVSRLRHARDLPPGLHRTQALVAWLERYGPEFRMSHPDYLRLRSKDDLGQSGWYEYEQEPFRWLLTAGDLDDSWQATQLYARLHNGELPPSGTAAFSSPGGRELLIRIAHEDERLEGDRARALALLTRQETRSGGGRPATWQKPMDAAERDRLVKEVIPLLAAPASALRYRTAEALAALSQPVGESKDWNREALPALEKAYDAEAPGGTRNALAEAILAVGGRERWKERTGQPDGIAAFLRDLGLRDERLSFALEVRPPGKRIHEVPTVYLERMDEKGKVLERKEMPLGLLTPLPLQDGLETSALRAELDVKDLEAGRWQVRVTGTVGKEPQKWTSEPRRFLVANMTHSGPGKAPKRAILLKEDLD